MEPVEIDESDYPRSIMDLKLDADRYFVIAITISMVAAMTVIALFIVGMQKSELEEEAVKRGYAEWYSDAPGGQPDSWRWKGESE